MIEIPEMPDRLSCAKCRETGKNIIHFAFDTLVDEKPNAKWFWHILEHDGTSKFMWPNGFKTKLAAQAFVQKLLVDAEEATKEGDDAV